MRGKGRVELQWEWVVLKLGHGLKSSLKWGTGSPKRRVSVSGGADAEWRVWRCGVASEKLGPS